MRHRPVTGQGMTARIADSESDPTRTEPGAAAQCFSGPRG